MASTPLDHELFDACDRCGEPFDADVRYPVVTREGTAGPLRVFSFCDEACEAAWRAGGD